MITGVGLPVEERLFLLLKHLGIEQAHFAACLPADWSGLATTHPEAISSLTLICPPRMDSSTLSGFTSPLLVFVGDQGPPDKVLSQAVASHPDATLVTLRNYSALLWADAVADRTEEVGSALTDFLGRIDRQKKVKVANLAEGEGEVAGITHCIYGSGPPLVLLPLALAPSQWEPLLPKLGERCCTITLAGAELGAAAILEARGHSAGYLEVVRNLINEANLRPGDEVLEVGCGTGVLTRWLARRTGGANRIVGVDISRYLLREAKALAKKEKLEGIVEFQEGNAEALPFPDGSFDVTLSCTVMEEVYADRMLAEMVRATKPGGRVSVLVRSVDMPFFINLPLRAEVKAKVEAPGAWGGGVGEKGCADSSLYRRFQQAGLYSVKMLPQLAIYAEKRRLEILQSNIIPLLDPEEVKEWRNAVVQAETEGTFFISQPFHSAVGTKPH